MTTMAEVTPRGRNALTWAAVSFTTYALIMVGAVAFLHRGGVGAVLKSSSTLTLLGAALLVATAGAGLGQRKLPVSPRNVTNFLIWNVLALALFALVMGGITALAGRAAIKAMGISATVALWAGLVLFFVAIVALLHVAASHMRMQLVSAEQSEAILDRVRALSYSLIATACMGLALVVLSLARPAGPVSAVIALAAVLVLLGVRWALSFATRPLLDELARTLSRETGQGAFNLIVVIGGGWSVLAHLRFVPAPAPLDWLTMLTVALFAASFRAASKRGLLATS